MRHNCLLFLFVLFCLELFSQQGGITVVDTLQARFDRQLTVYPQEKIYLQTDKSSYIMGETIWLRAHLVDGAFHLPDTTSRYVYIELSAPDDSIIHRIKIRPDKGAYGGHIDLPEDMAAGDYELCSYTRYMENQGEDLFFKRRIRIEDPFSALYKTDVSFAYKGDSKQDISVQVKFTEIASGKAIIPDRMRIKKKRDLSDVKIKVSSDSIIRFSIKQSKTEVKEALYIECVYLDKYHKEYLPINLVENDFDVAFFPEGGNLLADCNNKIAFKAINTKGMGEDISGIVVSAEGDTLTAFGSEHLGMGFFFFNPKPDMSYHVLCYDKYNNEKRFVLPEASIDQVALKTTWRSDALWVEVEKSSDMTVSQPLYLSIHSRGVLLKTVEWDNTILSFKKDALPSGVIHLLLIDSQMRPISERLVFNMNENDLVYSTFKSDKGSYKKREHVKASLHLKDDNGKPLLADLSVSVTDDYDITPDTCVNILTHLLLTSDLRGYIENPSYYFNKSNKVVLHLDLLMMTQGWRRYNIEKILQGEIEIPSIKKEFAQTITGEVKGGFFMNRKNAGYPVTLMAIEHAYIDETITDEKSQFIFRNFEMPDSTTFVIQGNTLKGGDGVEIFLNEEIFPIIHHQPRLTNVKAVNVKRYAEYIQKADQKYLLENGMRIIHLDEVEVTAKKINMEERLFRNPYSSPHNTFISNEEIEKNPFHSIYDLLRKVPGVYVSENKDVSFRGGKMPLIVIDGLPFHIRSSSSPKDLVEIKEAEYNIDNLVPYSEIYEIEIAKSASGGVVFGGKGMNGAIMITTKRGAYFSSKEVLEKVREIEKQYNVKHIVPLGYQVSKQFYSPKYEADLQFENNIPDLRSTIYWNPSLKTDNEGRVNFDFYTADSKTSYTVILEGVTSEGKLVYIREKIGQEQ